MSDLALIQLYGGLSVDHLDSADSFLARYTKNFRAGFNTGRQMQVVYSNFRKETFNKPAGASLFIFE